MGIVEKTLKTSDPDVLQHIHIMKDGFLLIYYLDSKIFRHFSTRGTAICWRQLGEILEHNELEMIPDSEDSLEGHYISCYVRTVK